MAKATGKDVVVNLLLVAGVAAAVYLTVPAIGHALIQAVYWVARLLLFTGILGATIVGLWMWAGVEAKKRDRRGW